MIKIAKIYPRDIIAFFTLIACFILMFFRIDSVVSGIAIAIIAFYFSKRLYEERNPNGDLNSKVKELEGKLNNQIPGSIAPQTPTQPPITEPSVVLKKPIYS